MDFDNPGTASTSGVKIVTRRYLYGIMRDQNLPNIEANLDYLENHLLSNYGTTDDDLKTIKLRFSSFKAKLKERWVKCHRKEDDFLKYNESWLEGTFELPSKLLNRPGRPLKTFDTASERTKRRKTQEIRRKLRESRYYDRLCSCHFVDGLKHKGPILPGKEKKSSPEKQTRKKKKETELSSDYYEPLVQETTIKLEEFDETPETFQFPENDEIEETHTLENIINDEQSLKHIKLIYLEEEHKIKMEILNIKKRNAEIQNEKLLIELEMKKIDLNLKRPEIN